VLQARVIHAVGLSIFALTVVAGAFVAALQPQVVLACSVGPDFDPIAESEVIVGGYIRDWRERPDVVSSVLPGFMPVEIDLRIDHTWKDAYDGAPILDRRSFRVEVVQNTGEMLRHWGSGGSCGALGGEPEGMYAVFGLSRDEDGNWAPSLPTTFYLDRAPYDPAAVTAYGRPLALPVAGSHQPNSGKGWPSTGVALASVVALAVLAGSAAWIRERARSSPPRT
jgi:hypothetical protein